MEGHECFTLMWAQVTVLGGSSGGKRDGDFVQLRRRLDARLATLDIVPDTMLALMGPSRGHRLLTRTSSYKESAFSSYVSG